MTLRERLARTPPGYEFTIGRVLAIYLGLMVDAAARGARPDDRRDRAAPDRLRPRRDHRSTRGCSPPTCSPRPSPCRSTAGSATSRAAAAVPDRDHDLPRRVGALRRRAGDDRAGRLRARSRGIGAGGLFPLSLAVIGAIVPPRDRGRWQGLIGAVFAAASIIGPAVGGFIVDNTSWRWVFLVNLPIGGLAAGRDLGDDAAQGRSRASTRSTGSAPACSPPARRRCCSALVWAGRDYAWTSSHVARRLRRGRRAARGVRRSSSGGRPSRSCRSRCSATRSSPAASAAWRSSA